MRAGDNGGDWNFSNFFGCSSSGWSWGFTVGLEQRRS
jgi:hypothetical protein